MESISKKNQYALSLAGYDTVKSGGASRFKNVPHGSGTLQRHMSANTEVIQNTLCLRRQLGDTPNIRVGSPDSLSARSNSNGASSRRSDSSKRESLKSEDVALLYESLFDADNGEQVHEDNGCGTNYTSLSARWHKSVTSMTQKNLSLPEDAKGVDFIKRLTGKVFNVGAYREEVGVTTLNKDQNFKTGSVPGFIDFLGRIPGRGIILDDVNVESIAQGKTGFIASFSSSAQERTRTEMVPELLKHSDKYEMFFINSDPGSADHAPGASIKFHNMIIEHHIDNFFEPLVPRLADFKKQSGASSLSQLALVAIPKSYFTK